MMHRLFAAVAVLLLGWTQSAFAARPLSTEDAGTVEAGAFETEIGADLVYGEPSCLGLCVKHGVTPRMDFGLSADLVPGADPSSLALGCKFRLLTEEDGKLPVSFIVSVDTADGSWSACAAAERAMGDGTLYLNLGVNTGLYTSAAWSTSLGEGTVCAEVLAGGDPSVWTTAGGGIAYPIGSAAVDAGVGFTLTDGGMDVALTVGATAGF